jgi:hypothetical protein
MRERAQLQAPIIARTLIAERAGRGRHHGAMHAHDQHEGEETQHDLLQRQIGQ